MGKSCRGCLLGFDSSVQHGMSPGMIPEVYSLVEVYSLGSGVDIKGAGAWYGVGCEGAL